MSNTIELEISLIPRLDETAFKATVNTIKSRFNVPADALTIKPQLDSKDFMSTFEVKMLSAKNNAKQLTGELALLTIEGKKGSAEYEKIEKELKDATAQAQKFEAAMGRVTKETDEANKNSNKAFNFNQSIQSVQILSSTVQGLSAPFIALDTATANMRTLGNEAAEMAPKLREAAIAMSEDLPFAAAEIQTTMFDALASGVKGGEEGLKTFASTAAKLATGGGAAIGEATGLLAGQLNAYGESSEAAAKYADIFFNTVNFGVTSIPQLATTLANVVPTAASLGIEIENVGAALAHMTSRGIPTAQSTTKLNALFIELAKPGAALAPILKQAGVSLESLRNESVPANLEKIKKTLEATGKVGLEVFSSSEAAAAFNSLTGDLAGFAQTFVDVRDTANSTQFAFDQMTDSIDVQIKSVMSGIEANLIKGLDLLGNKFVAVSSIAGQVAPTFATIASVKQIIPEGITEGLNTFKNSMGEVVKNGGGIKGALGVVGSGFSGMIAPIRAMGAALMTNPIFLIAGLAVGTVAAIKLISDAMHDTAEEKKEEAKADSELLQKQKENSDAKASAILKNRDLLTSYQELNNTQNRTAEQEAELQNQRVKLSALYPNMISSNKSLADSVKEAGIAADKAGKDYLNAVGASQELAKKQLENSKLQISLDVSIKKEELENTLTESTKNFGLADYAKTVFFPISFAVDPQGTANSFKELSNIASEFLFGTSIGRKEQENFVKQYSDMVYKAKDSTEINNARIEFANAIGVRTDLTAQQKNEAIKQFDEFAQSQLKGLEQIKKADEDFVNNRSSEFTKSYNAIGVNAKDVNKVIADMARVFGISNAAAREQVISAELQNAAKDGKLTAQEISGISSKLKLTGDEAKKTGVIIQAAMSDKMKQFAADGDVSKEEIKEIAKQFGLTEKEAKKVVDLQLSLNVEAAKTKSLIDGVKGAFKAASDEASKNYEASKSLAQDSYIKALEARKNGNKELEKELNEQSKKEYKKSAETLDALNKLKKDGQKRDVEFQRNEAAERAKANKEARAELENLLESNNSKSIELKNTGFIKELALLNDELEKQVNAVRESDDKIQKNSKLYDKLKEDFARAHSLQIINITEEGEKKRRDIITSYSSKIIEDENKKNNERLQKELDNATKNVDAINNKINETLSTAQFIDLTSSFGDARIALLDKQQQKEVETYLQGNVMFQAAQKEYARALLDNDKNAADAAKRNLDLLTEALKINDDGLKSLIVKQNSEREALQLENVTKLSEATFGLIEGDAQREYALALQTARKTYDEKLKAAKGNHTLILAAEQEFNAQKEQLEANYLSKTNSLQAESNKFRLSLMENFQNDLVKMLNASPETEAQQKELEEQEKQLRKSLVSRQITETEFMNKYAEIESKRREISQESFDIISALQSSFTTSVASSADALKVSMNNSTKDYVKLLSSQSATEEDYNKARTKLFEDAAATMGVSMISFATQSGITMKGFMQQSLDLAFDMLQKNSLIIAAEIFGKSVAANPILGAFAAGGLTAAFFGLISIAKSAIGKKEGEARVMGNVGIDNKPITQTSDNVLRLVSRDEAIVNAYANTAYDSTNNVYNYQIVEWANKNKKPFSEYYNQKTKIIDIANKHVRNQTFMRSVNTEFVQTISNDEVVTAINTQTKELIRANNEVKTSLEDLKRYASKQIPSRIKFIGEFEQRGNKLMAAVEHAVKLTHHLEA